MVRLYTIKVFATSEDPFYDGVPINIWSMIEINVAIICASVPGTSAPRLFDTCRMLVANFEFSHETALHEDNSRSGH